jgi:hypothetical protein
VGHGLSTTPAREILACWLMLLSIEVNPTRLENTMVLFAAALLAVLAIIVAIVIAGYRAVTPR